MIQRPFVTIEEKKIYLQKIRETQEYPNFDIRRLITKVINFNFLSFWKSFLRPWEVVRGPFIN